MYIHLEAEYLFDNVKTDETKHTMRRFTTKNDRKCDKYFETLINLMEEAKLGEKIKKCVKI